MYLQHWHGWCHKKLLPSQHVLCTLYNHAPCHFMQSHIRKVDACFSCNLCFWQNDQGLLCATAVTWGWTDTEIRVSTESWPWRRKFSCRSSRDSNPGPFDHESSALTTEPSPPPCLWLTEAQKEREKLVILLLCTYCFLFKAVVQEWDPRRGPVTDILWVYT